MIFAEPSKNGPRSISLGSPFPFVTWMEIHVSPDRANKCLRSRAAAVFALKFVGKRSNFLPSSRVLRGIHGDHRRGDCFHERFRQRSLDGGGAARLFLNGLA